MAVLWLCHVLAMFSICLFNIFRSSPAVKWFVYFVTQQPWEFFYSIDQIFSFLPEHTNILSSSTRRNKNFHWVKQKKLNEGENLSHILCRFCGGLFWFLGQCSCCRHKVKGYQEICCDKKLYFKFFPCKNTAIGTFYSGTNGVVVPRKH